jgi:hypothetical protein
MQWPSLTRPLSRMREHSEPRQGRYKRNMRVSNRSPFLGKPVSQAGREHSAENRICTVETDAGNSASGTRLAPDPGERPKQCA